MGGFGTKNDLKISVYKIVSGLVVVGVVTIVAVIGILRIRENMDKGEVEASITQYAKAESEEDATEVFEVTNTSTPEPTKASLMGTDPNLDAYYRVSVIAANASSTIAQKNTNNSPMMLFDGRDDTTWQEGVNGYGINENIAFSFDSTVKVKYIGFKLGNWRNDKYYFGNAKPKTMTLIFGDYSGQVTFTGERKVEWVEVNNIVNADSMRITIDDVYPGTIWEDTCITEIMVYAEK